MINTNYPYDLAQTPIFKKQQMTPSYWDFDGWLKSVELTLQSGTQGKKFVTIQSGLKRVADEIYMLVGSEATP